MSRGRLRGACRPRATERGIDFCSESGGTTCLQPGISHARSAWARAGLPEQVGDAGGRRHWVAVNDSTIGQERAQPLTSLVQIATKQRNTGHRQQRRDARWCPLPVVPTSGRGRWPDLPACRAMFGGQRPNGHQLPVVRQQLIRNLGGFVNLPQLEQSTGEARRGAGAG